MRKNLKRISALLCVFSMMFSTILSVSAAEDHGVRAAYYEQYGEIVQRLSEETGTKITLLPAEEFEEEDWRTPAQFEEVLRSLVTGGYTVEQTASERSSDKTTKEVSFSNGENSYKISVTGKFETQYNSTSKRQLFSSVSSITSKMSSTSRGTWDQNSYSAKKTDSGRTYQISVSGTVREAGTEFDKIVRVEFYCDSKGGIS